MTPLPCCTRILGILLLVVAGCGPAQATHPVTGKVTFADGKPLAGAMVEFETTLAGGKRLNAQGETAADGSYRLTTPDMGEGAVAGEQRVIVGQPMIATPSNMSGPPPKDAIDRKYQSYESSGLSCTVKAGEKNEYNITVTPPGK
jgi:hypothetical protein